MIKKRKVWSLLSLAASLLIGDMAAGQEVKSSTRNLPVQYEELTAPNFEIAITQSHHTCIIPFGILEKHGLHLPLGTDLLDVREMALRAARKEYTIVFPPYYFGQIFEAKHQPGTIAYSPRMIWELLQETRDELSRNGIKKIIIVNGHGGNTNFLRYFCQAQLASRKDYAVFLFTPANDPQLEAKLKAMRKTSGDDYAGETETSILLAHRPDLVHIDRAKNQSGEDQKRLDSLHQAYVGIWWYARCPNHYAGDGSPANRELGELLLNSQVEQLVTMIREVKQDENVLELQNRFFDEAETPLPTKH